MSRKRVKRLLEGLPKDFEAALIQTESNRFYFLDFDAQDAGTLLLLRDAAYYFVDSRYIESANREVQMAQVCLQKDLYTQIKEILQKEGVRKIYLEQEISVALYKRQKEKFSEFVLDVSATLSDEIRQLRAVKDEEEQERIRKAQTLTDACFQHILPRIVQGACERDLMLEMERFLRASGAQQVAFDTIFLTGVNTSLPHGHPGETRLQKGDFITMDFGAKVHGYCSDMTRTVALGEPSAEQKEVYEIVLQAHLEALQAVQSGCVCKDVDKVARDVIRKAGYAEYFGHGLGHAVGIDIHEEPRLSPLCSEKLAAGMVVTIEPGIYMPKKFGCRIEDTVIVGANGCEALPKSPKDLLIL